MGALLYRWNGCVVLCLCFYNGFDCSFSLQYHVMAVNVVSSLMDVCFVASPSATACSFSFFSSYLVLMMGCGSVGMVQREWNALTAVCSSLVGAIMFHSLVWFGDWMRWT
eukprot:28714_1